MATKTQSSNFWLNREFDVDFGKSNKDYTKLAAAQRAIGNFVNIVTGKQIPVVFQNNDSSYTDGESVVIGTTLDGKNFDSAVGLALHEGSHIAYTDFDIFKGGSTLATSNFSTHIRYRGLDPDCNMSNADLKHIKDLLNWIEDRRIDLKVYTNAPGYRSYYESMYAVYFNDKIIDKALQKNAKIIEDWDCYMFHIINFTNPHRNLNALKRLRDIWNLIDLKTIGRLESTLDALDLACDTYRIIKEAVSKVELKKLEKLYEDNGLISNEKSPGNSSPESDKSSNTTPSEEWEDEPESDKTDMDGNAPDSNKEDYDETDDTDDQFSGAEYDEDDDSDESAEEDTDSKDEVKEEIIVTELSTQDQARLEKAIKSQSDFLNGQSKKTGRLSKSQSRLVNAIKESGTETREVYTSMDGKADPVTTVVIKKINAGIICTMPHLFDSWAADYINNVRTISTQSNSSVHKMDIAVQKGILLGKQLGNKLQLRNADKSLKSTRLQTGKIDRRLVAQLGYNNVNVFHRIVTDHFKNYFIHISIDASGSMSGGDKLHNAITSAVAIAQAASMTNGIRVQISLRGTSHDMSGTEQCVTMYAYDSAHDKLNKIKTYFKYLKTFGLTPEGIAFKSIIKDIKTDAKGDELIFINYSDGEPTSIKGCYRNYDGVEFTRAVINEMKSYNISILSYFIYDRFYSTAVNLFKRMYGADAQFIQTGNMMEVAKTINNKFLEIAN
jgi:ribosomal protein S18